MIIDFLQSWHLCSSIWLVFYGSLEKLYKLDDDTAAKIVTSFWPVMTIVRLTENIWVLRCFRFFISLVESRMNWTFSRDRKHQVTFSCEFEMIGLAVLIVRVRTCVHAFLRDLLPAVCASLTPFYAQRCWILKQLTKQCLLSWLRDFPKTAEEFLNITQAGVNFCCGLFSDVD